MTKPPQKPVVAKLTKGPLNYYGMREKFRVSNQLEIELLLMQFRSGSLRHRDASVNPKGLPAWRHFCNAVDLIWNFQGSQTQFRWHPWAITMIRDAFKHKRYAVTSGGSGGKTDVFAIWALVWWLAKPFKNVVLVNTTTKTAAMGRIWGRIVRYFNGMAAPAPGKLVGSSYSIKAVDPRTGAVSEEYGVRLFAGEPSKAAESATAIRGLKHGPGGKLIVILDECAELSWSIVNTFEENLTQNPNVQLIALANANSPFDTFGRLCEPKDGWDHYDPAWDEWEGKGAHVRRINIESSPNITEGRVLYPFLMTKEMLDEKREKLGLNSRSYWRGVLGAFLLDGDDETIYSPGEILRVPKDCTWQGVPTKVAGLDISHTVGGDKTVLTIGQIGICTDGKKRLQFLKHIYLQEDVRKKDVDRTTQIITELKKICAEEGIAPENLATDSSAGGGKTFADALWSQWSNAFLRVDFGGKASDRPVSAADREKSSVRFANRVSELWAVGKELIRCDQLRNITKEMADDMTSRRYKDNKAADGGSRIKVESKVEMKQRINRSPDVFDSGAVLIELCRTRHGLASIDKPGNSKPGVKSPLKRRFDALASLFAA
jgi:hypothetical protein